MIKKPEYADKITFQGVVAFINAIDYLYNGGKPDTGWQILNKYHIYDTIKLTDVYKFSPNLTGCKKIIREVGKRINDMLTMAGIDYKKADFISSSNLYTYPNKCYGRPHMHVYTDKDMLLLDFINKKEFIIRNTDNEEIHYKMDGTYFYDDFKVTKITEINEENLDDDISFKSFKNENDTIFKVFKNDDKLEIIVGNSEIENENSLVDTIKYINLKDYNMEHIFKKIKESISLQKNDKTYLSIKKYKNKKITDEITIKKGKIKISKFLNDNLSYKLHGNIEGNIDSWKYKGDCLISYNEFGKNKKEKHLEIRNADSEIKAIEMCNKVSDDINNQHKKILSYIKK